MSNSFQKELESRINEKIDVIDKSRKYQSDDPRKEILSELQRASRILAYKDVLQMMTFINIDRVMEKIK